MTDADITMIRGASPSTASMTDGSGAHLAEQLSIEADRLSGTMQDGVAAAQAAAKDYGSLFIDAYIGMIQGSMRSGIDLSGHFLALLQAKSLADVFKMNTEFMQKQMSSAQERLLEMTGVKGTTPNIPGPERRA